MIQKFTTTKVVVNKEFLADAIPMVTEYCVKIKSKQQLAKIISEEFDCKCSVSMVADYYLDRGLII